jgi:hypothetical protein
MESQQIVELLLSMQAKMETNRQVDQEILQETMKTNQDDLLKTVKEEMMAVVDAYHERMMACLGMTEADTEKTEPDPGMMQSTEEHQEIFKGEAAVMPVGELRKRRRVLSLAAEHHQKRKERIQGEVGCRLQEGVSLCKSGMAQEERRQKYWDTGKLRTTQGVRRRRNKGDLLAKVARCKGRSHEEPSVQRERQKTQTRIQFARASRKGWTLGMRQLMCLLGTNGTRNRDFKEQLRLGNERTTSEQ